MLRVGIDPSEIYLNKRNGIKDNIPRFLNRFGKDMSVFCSHELINLTTCLCTFRYSMLFLRLLGLHINQQNMLFDFFCSILEQTVGNAKRDGLYCDGIPTLTGKSRVLLSCVRMSVCDLLSSA